MSGSAAAAASSSATSTALSVATAAICFAIGYVNQLLVGAEPFGDDPRPVTRDVNAAYPLLKDREDLQLIRKAIKQYYPAATALKVAPPAPSAPPVDTYSAPAPAPAPSAPPAGAVPVPLPRYSNQMGGGSQTQTQTHSDSAAPDQTIPAAGGSTDAPRPLSGGEQQPQGYLQGHAHIGVGQ